MISRPDFRLLWLIAAVAMMAGCASAPDKRSAGQRTANQDIGSRAAGIAAGQVGAPYVFGGSTPQGFDCSGLVHYSYARVGQRVPRTTGALWNSARPVDRSDLRAGDVLFFNVEGKMSHVGLYLGDRRFVHAPSSGKVVSVATLDTAYYSRSFIRAGRLY